MGPLHPGRSVIIARGTSGLQWGELIPTRAMLLTRPSSIKEGAVSTCWPPLTIDVSDRLRARMETFPPSCPIDLKMVLLLGEAVLVLTTRDTWRKSR
jgi:hypothetical protein